MFEVRLTVIFSRWLEDLRDAPARDRVLARLRRFELGNFGDSNSVGSGIMEARIDYGPRYRLYYSRQGDVVVVMLCAGDKSSQERDKTAKAMAKDF